MQTRTELIDRLHAGGEKSWLSPGEVAIVLKVGRTTVDRMLKAEVIRSVPKPGVGRHRLCRPADVIRELESRAALDGADTPGE